MSRALIPIGRGQFDDLSWLRARRLFDLFKRMQTCAEVGSGLGCECVDVKEVSILITPAKLPMPRSFQRSHMKHNTWARIVTKLPWRIAKMLNEQRRAFCVQFLFSDSDEPITHGPSLAPPTL